MSGEDPIDILLVNDEPANLTALAAALEDTGLNVVPASSGEEALRHLLARDFAVILLDVMMPKLDGFATAELIRRRHRSASTPIIFITAAAQSLGEQFKGYELGAVDYLLAPVAAHVLRTKVSVFAELYRKNRILAQQKEELAAAHRQLQQQRVEELTRMNAELAAEVSERREAEARAHFLATRDALTGLLNRRALHDQLEMSIEAARRHNEMLALLFIDLDHFKSINDSLGHPVGDDLLKQVASRLLDSVRKADVVARLGGDEFVVLLDGIADPASASEVADKLVATLSQPFVSGPHVLHSGASIGLGIFPNDGAEPMELLRNADIAMYHAKQLGRGHWQYFSAELNDRVTTRNELMRDLRGALERGELALHYQPEWQIATGRIVGVEALLRWSHPARGMVPNEIFIPIAEETGLIVPIGSWVIDEACAQIRRWLDAGLTDDALSVAVNVSVPQFRAGLTDLIEQTLDRHGVPARRLQLEITETMLATNMAQLQSELKRLGAMGVQLAIDDFGTGYSSLAMLKVLPLDLLKIDQSFVRDLNGDPDSTAIVQAIVGLGHALGMSVIAEGVETERQLAALRDLGCDKQQGFLSSQPVAADELTALLLSGSDLAEDDAA